jgi:CRP/FNR family cyclic AMP-dependent transcriptional regulator
MFTQRTHRVPVTRINALRRTPMFAGLSDAALARIDAQMVEVDVAENTVLTVEGDPAREAFIVVEGRASVSVHGRPISCAFVGDIIGETALLDPGPRTATVVALTPMRLYVLDPAQFGTLFDDPSAGLWIARQLAQRLREATTRTAQPAHSC